MKIIAFSEELFSLQLEPLEVTVLKIEARSKEISLKDMVFKIFETGLKTLNTSRNALQRINGI